MIEKIKKVKNMKIYKKPELRFLAIQYEGSVCDGMLANSKGVHNNQPGEGEGGGEGGLEFDAGGYRGLWDDDRTIGQ